MTGLLAFLAGLLVAASVHMALLGHPLSLLACAVILVLLGVIYGVTRND
ncbi:hypothetical protein [Vibrio phage CKB-S1]|nr:hypothetical protein [Vibrio phage CKB-S1]